MQQNFYNNNNNVLKRPLSDREIVCHDIHKIYTLKANIINVAHVKVFHCHYCLMNE